MTGCGWKTAIACRRRYRQKRDMEPEALIAKVREHYLEQFTDFVMSQKQSCDHGASEVKLLLSDQSSIFRNLYCVDFIQNDSGSKVIEFAPENLLIFEPLSGSFGTAELVIEQLRWDDIVVHHDAQEPALRLSDWFEKWFDPDDKRYVEGDAFGNVIHSLSVEQGIVSVDFGSAGPDAFWDLLDILEVAGAKSLRVTASRLD